MAANPVFCTELSELNSKRKEFPSLVITGGNLGKKLWTVMVGYFSYFSDFTNLDPQKSPCFLTSPDPILEDKAKLSYSQSCYKEKWTKNICNNKSYFLHWNFWKQKSWFRAKYYTN